METKTTTLVMRDYDLYGQFPFTSNDSPNQTNFQIQGGKCRRRVRLRGMNHNDNNTLTCLSGRR